MMNDTINEQISAFADGELPDAERELLQHRMVADDELQSTWQRYHLIRDAMREDLPDVIFRNTGATTFKDDIVLLDDNSAAVTMRQRFARPAAGFAIAASVAMLAVVGVLSTNDPVGSSAGLQFAAGKTNELPDDFLIRPRNGWNSPKPAVVSHLNAYLVDHSNYGGFGASQSIIPYSRVAGYDQPVADIELKMNASNKVSTDE